MDIAFRWKGQEGYERFFRIGGEYFLANQEIMKKDDSNYWHQADKAMLMYLGIEESERSIWHSFFSPTSSEIS